MLTARPAFLAGIAIAAVIGVLVGTYSVPGAIAVVAVLSALVAWFWPATVFIASILALIAGQLVRLPLGWSDSAVLINDVLLPVLIVTWFLRRLASRRWSLPRWSLTLPLGAWLLMMTVSVLANIGLYDSDEALSGMLYVIRWTEYAALLYIAYDMFTSIQQAARYRALMIWTGLIIAGLGFLQLRVFPDFSFMVPQGWDPHVGRLLSTWFDPNFLAGYLAFLTCVALAIALSLPLTRAKWWWAAAAVMTAAIVLTFSRSGYVALVIGVSLIALIRSRTLLVAGLFAIVLVVAFVPRVQERVIGIRTVDETAQLRIISWTNAFEVIEDHPWFGVGYNFYRTVQVRYGFLDNPLIHSASGSDSSLLTAWVTTGALGLIAAVWLSLAVLRETIRTWRDRSLPDEWRGFGLGCTAGLVALAAHAQFVNSLFYPHIMQTVWIFVAMTVAVRQRRV